MNSFNAFFTQIVTLLLLQQHTHTLFFFLQFQLNLNADATKSTLRCFYSAFFPVWFASTFLGEVNPEPESEETFFWPVVVGRRWTNFSASTPNWIRFLCFLFHALWLGKVVVGASDPSIKHDQEACCSTRDNPMLFGCSRCYLDLRPIPITLD